MGLCIVVQTHSLLKAAIMMHIRQRRCNLSSVCLPPKKLVACCLLVVGSWPRQSHSFSLIPQPLLQRQQVPKQQQKQYHLSSRLHVEHVRDADFMEMMIGGERYEMVPLPDAMMDTTLFVGNLCEFCTDDDLSQLFQSVSILNYVPACIVRKPNMSSLRYGFVAFPTIQEKEAAIVRFDGMEWRGQRIKVECIRDHPSNGQRVRVPERMVAYVSGVAKKAPGGRCNNTLRRISRDDVERLSRGQPAKKKGWGSRNVPHRLNDVERQELDRAARRGYVTLNGTGYRRGRKGSPLANIHRQWCDARDKPQILLCKASAGRSLDNVIVDLSPLRLHGLCDDPNAAAERALQWKTEILEAASNAGMKLRSDYIEDNIEDAEEEIDNIDEEQDNDHNNGNDNNESNRHSIESVEYHVTTLTSSTWATQPIWKLPVVSIGVFEGDRSHAKAMAKELAELWDIPEAHADSYSGGPPLTRRQAGAKHGGRTKMKGLSQHRYH